MRRACESIYPQSSNINARLPFIRASSRKPRSGNEKRQPLREQTQGRKVLHCTLFCSKLWESFLYKENTTHNANKAKYNAQRALRHETLLISLTASHTLLARRHCDDTLRCRTLRDCTYACKNARGTAIAWIRRASERATLMQQPEFGEARAMGDC